MNIGYIIYYFFPVYALILYVLDLYTLKNRNVLYLLSCIFFLLFFGFGMLRGAGIGTDYYTYKELFFYPEDIEPGYKLLTNIIFFLGGGFQFFIATIFLLSFSLKCYSFKTLSLYPFLSILLYLGFWFLVYDMNAIRQGLSLGICGVSLCFLYKKKFTFYVLTIFFATLFHFSAIIMLPFYFIVRRTCTLKFCFSIFFVSFFLSLFGASEFIILLLGKVFGADNQLVSKALSYGLNEMYNSNVLFSFTTIHRVLLFIIACVFIPRIKTNTDIKNIFLWAALINIVIYLLFCQFEVIATRLSLYYRFVECFFLSYLPSSFAGKSNKILIGFLLYVYVVWQIYSTLSIPDGNLSPYHFALF